MDSLRIGKALGIATRVATKATTHAMEQNAAQKQKTAQRTAHQPEVLPPAARAQQAATQARNIARGAGRFGEAIWGPFVHLSRVVWLESMGVLFAFVALYFWQTLFRFHADLLRPATDPAFQHYMLFIAATAMFTYFTISSFVRASRRSRKRSS